MTDNFKLLGESYIGALQRIRLAGRLTADELRVLAAKELFDARMRVRQGGYLWPSKARKAH